jgi:hypothetical protein
MHPIKAEQKVTTGTQATGWARGNAPRTIVKHVEVLVEIRTLELLIIEDLDPLPTADHHPTSPGPTPTQCPKSR